MSFFSNIETDGTFEAAPAIEVIPNDTTCVAMLDDAGWTDTKVMNISACVGIS